MQSVCVATEGLIDTAVVRRICQEVKLEISADYGESGKNRLDGALAGYNAAARHGSWLVLRDLDTDADCAPTLRARLLAVPASGMAFRIAVREIEAWLIADLHSFAQYFSIPVGRVSTGPESIHRPKEYLVNLVRRSRSRTIRDDVVPRDGSRARVGPGYAGRMIEFASTVWSPHGASVRSDSLKRCLARLSHLRTR